MMFYDNHANVFYEDIFIKKSLSDSIILEFYCYVRFYEFCDLLNFIKFAN